MRSILAMLTAVAWALWLGGLAALFLFVSVLFKQDRAVAVEAAPRMFAVFERYQLVLAAVALITTTAWRLVDRRVILTALFGMFALATLAAVLEPVYISGEMQRLRVAGESGSDRFRQLHGRSMMVYVGETLVLLVAATMLPKAIERPPAAAPPAVV
jgi:hypothetical protein